MTVEAQRFGSEDESIFYFQICAFFSSALSFHCGRQKVTYGKAHLPKRTPLPSDREPVCQGN